MSAELDSPFILLVDKKISNIREMLPVLEGVAKVRPSAAGDCRRRGRRSAGHSGGQQHARHRESGSRQGPWLW
jgi:hypothetical protein